MKNKILLFIAVIALSCQSDNDTTNQNTMTLITGINLRQSFDDEPLHLGNPNILVNNKFLIYPNPVVETFVLSSQQNFTDVWIVPAKAEKIHQNVSFENVLDSNLYSQESISEKSDFALNGQSTDFLSINIASLPKGYYKVFVKIDGVIYWDNLYKYEENGTTETQFNALMDFWN